MGKKGAGSAGHRAVAKGADARSQPVGEAQWRGVLAQQKASGLAIAAFCQREQLNESTLRYWSWRLAREAKQVAAMAKPPFLAMPIHPTASATLAPASEFVEVELGVLRIRFGGALAVRVADAVLARMEVAQ